MKGIGNAAHGPESTGSLQRRHAGTWRERVFPLFVSFVSLVYNGYQFGTADQTIYTPLVLRIVNPALFAGDYLFDQPSGQYTLWLIVMATFARVLAVDWAYFAVHVLATAAFFLGIYRLSFHLFGSQPAANLAVLLLLLPYTIGSTGTFTHDVYLTMRGTAMPFTVWSVISYYRGRMISMALLCGIALVLHPITAFPIACLFFVWCLINATSRGWRRPLGALAVFAGFAVVLLFHGQQAGTTTTTSLAAFVEIDSEWLEAVRALNRDAFPTLANLFMAAFFLTILFVSLRLQNARRSGSAADVFDDGALTRKGRVVSSVDEHHESPVFLTQLVMFVMSALLLSASVLLVWYPIPLLVQLRVLRSLYVLVDLGMIHLAWLLWEGTQALSAQRRRLAGVLLWLGVALALVAWRHDSLADIVFKGNVAPYIDLPGRTPESARIVGLRQSRGNLEFVPPPDAAAVPGHNRRAWVEAAQWCREHTRIDAVYLVPPETQGFRIFSERSVVGESADGPPGIFSAPYYREWQRRMASLQDYDTFDRVRLVDVGARYGANFAVTRRSRILDLPVVFQNDGYVVYELPRAPTPP